MNAAPPDQAPTQSPPAAPARPKSARRRSREFALQGLYEWLVGRAGAEKVHAHMREQDEFDKCDSAHFDALLSGCISQSDQLEQRFAPHLDRPVAELSPVERSILMLGSYELLHCLDIPYRVAINEAVELAKVFGGTDGHKFVNGVLDRTAKDLRPAEVAAQRQRGPRQG